MNQELMLSEEELRKYKIKKTLQNVGIYAFLVVIALFIKLCEFSMKSAIFEVNKCILEVSKISEFNSLYCSCGSDLSGSTDS